MTGKVNNGREVEIMLVVLIEGDSPQSFRNSLNNIVHSGGGRQKNPGRHAGRQTDGQTGGEANEI